MSTLKNSEKYRCLVINDIIFEMVQVYICLKHIEIINSWGNTVAVIYKQDIKTIEVLKS